MARSRLQTCSCAVFVKSIWSLEKRLYLPGRSSTSAGWPARNDECHNIHPLTCAKWQPHLRPSPALGGHRRSPLSCHGNRRHEGKFSWAHKHWHLMPSPTDSVELHIQVWKQEWEVVVYLIFLRVTRVACQPHSFSHSLILFLSPASKPIFTRTLVDICSHIFSLSASLHSIQFSHTIYSCYFEQQSTGATLPVCVSEIVSVIPALSDCCDLM